MYILIPEDAFSNSKYKNKHVSDGLFIIKGVMNLEGKRKWKYDINKAKIVLDELNKKVVFNDKEYELKNFHSFEKYFNDEYWNISDDNAHVEAKVSIPVKIISSK